MKRESCLYAPLFFGVVLLLAGLSSPLASLVSRFSTDAFLSRTLVQLLVFLLPLAFYCRLRSLNPVNTLKFRLTDPKLIPLIVILVLILLTGTAVLRYFGLFFFDDAFVNTPGILSVPGKVTNSFLAFLSSVLLPAVLEECVFRGVLLEEYRSYGMVWSVGVTSLMFAMAHLSLANFVYYLFLGVILGIVAYLSDSIVPGILIHVLVNFSYLNLRPFVVEYLRQAGKSPLLPYLLIAFFLVMFVFLFSGLETMYREKAGDEKLQSRKEILRREVEKTRGLEEVPPAKERILQNCKEIYLSPAFLGSVAIFILLLFGIFS
ncbi:MAG: CPBP family intramembrane metalloprotease [Clostridia bacterium]|nr:CPBP family intramembrane metalloprotease [Clostridia bacterium]